MIQAPLSESFAQPIGDRAKSEEQIVKFFGGNAPPMVFVEWTSRNPVEIEVIARTGGTSENAIGHSTPTGERASPVFSRIARLDHPSTIYTSGLYGRAGGNGSEQIHDIYASLMGILQRTGSDLDHLAKATYYPSDNDPSTKLNEIRPEYYDPRQAGGVTRRDSPRESADNPCEYSMQILSGTSDFSPRSAASHRPDGGQWKACTAASGTRTQAACA